ncbi:hypothetical protein FisN_4Lu517 [Fistulifera solaris]|uniref:Protein tweety homolog n=1 Tax=Fistulifera solaris TaxID=1519565 RepID=A0A1Z5JZR8_FISSO|nr:hypothetical protein FisN_4Lu517 [Fistulifera solaris]|eukprot:GAX19261.1 hypothetical protein FisN_4Lu517 [Fistulifera solaris]
MAPDDNSSRVESNLAMRKAPRFGHTREFAAVVSEESRDEYIDGLAAFAVFIFAFTFVWLVIIFLFKFHYGVDRVGWAAGGDVVDVEYLRKQGISRKHRTQRIHRNWRVQSTFLIASMCIPVLSFLLVNHGLEPFIESLMDIEDMTNDVATQAYIGIYTGQQIDTIYNNLRNLVSHNVTTLCPDFPSSLLNNESRFTVAHEDLSNSLTSLLPVVNETIPITVEVLEAVTTATRKAEDIVDIIRSHDWLLILLLAVLNIINAFFLFGVFLTKNNVGFPVLQAFTGYLLVPSFLLVLLVFVCASGLFAAAAISNADFCSGGYGVPNPIGTFRDISIRLGYKDNSVPLTALEYYTSNCRAEHPLALINEAKRYVEMSTIRFDQLSDALKSTTWEEVPDGCEVRFPFSNSSFHEIADNLGMLQDNFNQVLELTSCSNMRPIFHYLSSGSICTESVSGLSVLFALTSAISVLGLVLLTTRAAIFNPIIKARRIKRREKEFNEYKCYMARYYDTDTWKMDPPKPFENDIICLSTMESDDTSPRSFLTDSDGTTVETKSSIVQHSEETLNLSLQSDGKFFRKSQFYHGEIEVIYYSSDSDSDDENGESVSISRSLNSSMSTLSGLLWSSGRATAQYNKSKSETDPQACPTVKASDVTGTTRSNNMRLFFGTGPPLQSPKMAKPEVQEPSLHISVPLDHDVPHHDITSNPLSLGNMEVSIDDLFDDSCDHPFAEAPSTPDAPQKKVSAVARTAGARTIEIRVKNQP